MPMLFDCYKLIERMMYGRAVFVAAVLPDLIWLVVYCARTVFTEHLSICHGNYCWI